MQSVKLYLLSGRCSYSSSPLRKESRDCARTLTLGLARIARTIFEAWRRRGVLPFPIGRRETQIGPRPSSGDGHCRAMIWPAWRTPATGHWGGRWQSNTSYRQTPSSSFGRSIEVVIQVVGQVWRQSIPFLLWDLTRQLPQNVLNRGSGSVIGQFTHRVKLELCYLHDA